MFTVPDKGEGLNDVQSIWFQEYIDVLVAGISGVDCVLSGCAVTAQAAPDMTVAVAAGSVRANNVVCDVTAGNGTITAADATNPRLDLVVITSAGVIAVRAGTASSTPKPPNKTANDVVLAVVFVPAGDTAIESNQIVDLKVVAINAANLTGTANININGTVGATTAAAGTFTTVTANGGLTINTDGGATAGSAIDQSAARVSIAASGTRLFSAFSGMILVNNHNSGGVSLFLVGAGSTLKGLTVGERTGSMSYVAPDYVWTSDSTTTDFYTFTKIRTRTAP